MDQAVSAATAARDRAFLKTRANVETALRASLRSWLAASAAMVVGGTYNLASGRYIKSWNPHADIFSKPSKLEHLTRPGHLKGLGSDTQAIGKIAGAVIAADRAGKLALDARRVFHFEGVVGGVSVGATGWIDRSGQLHIGSLWVP